MGWRINTNNIDQRSIFSSVTDDDIAKFNTQEELLNFIALEEIYKGKKKAIEILMTYPNGWTVNNKRMFMSDEQKHDEYFKWLYSISDHDTYEEYYKAIDNKLNELMKQNEVLKGEING